MNKVYASFIEREREILRQSYLKIKPLYNDRVASRCLPSSGAVLFCITYWLLHTMYNYCSIKQVIFHWQFPCTHKRRDLQYIKHRELASTSVGHDCEYFQQSSLCLNKQRLYMFICVPTLPRFLKSCTKPSCQYGRSDLGYNKREFQWNEEPQICFGCKVWISGDRDQIRFEKNDFLREDEAAPIVTIHGESTTTVTT